MSTCSPSRREYIAWPGDWACGVSLHRGAGAGNTEDELFTLNETGTASWGRLDGQRSLADVAAAFESELEGAEDGARERDVLGVGEEAVGD